ncbi:MAG TPA: hypothetical protein VMV10_21250, partial [Pirellulales bacterium]|nr:hypothetical protein [Pirellulales bacterium]
PASSAGNKHIPCALTVTASLLPWWVLFQTPRYSRTVTCAYFNGIEASPALSEKQAYPEKKLGQFFA